MSTVCEVNKIDSNLTGLSFAEEACLKVLPSVGAGDLADPEWYGLEPNSYNDFGGDLATTARQPISASRQRKKGTVVGLSATGGFNQDLTQTNLSRLIQGFLMTTASEKPTTRSINPLQVARIPLTSVAATDDSYSAASGLGVFRVGHIVVASGFSNAANNGVFRVLTVAAGKITTTNTNSVDEASPPAEAKIEAVGYRFASGELTLTSNAQNAVLAVGGLATASGTFTITSTNNALADETVTIGGIVYTFKATVSTVAGQVKIGADKAATCANLAQAINATPAGAGSVYGSLTMANPYVTATSGAGTLSVSAKGGGTSGNGVATTDTVTNGSWGGATLSGGTGSSGFIGLGLQAGEWIFIGGDDPALFYTHTSSTNREGYARIGSIADGALTLDDTTFDPQTDVGTGKTVEIYFGTVMKNGAKVRSFQLERTLGVDSQGRAQAQYIEGWIPNEFTLNFPSEDKLTADLNGIALNDSTRTGEEGLKSGTRFSAPGEAAINSSLDLYRIRMAVLDPDELNPDALFGYVTEATLTMNNNASPAKALGHLGGFDVNVGNFDAGGTLTAYFQTVEAIRAIRQNADIAFNFIIAHANAGIVYDLPLVGVGGGRLNIELNNPVTIPLTASGAENKNGYTMLANWFAYLPDIAMPTL